MSPALARGTRVREALRAAVAREFDRKRRLGHHVVIWKNGRVVRLEPQEHHAGHDRRGGAHGCLITRRRGERGASSLTARLSSDMDEPVKDGRYFGSSDCAWSICSGDSPDGQSGCRGRGSDVEHLICAGWIPHGHDPS